MALNDDLETSGHNGEEQADTGIDNDLAAFIGSGHRGSLHAGDVVQSAHDAQRCRRNADGGTVHYSRRDIAPERRTVNRIARPNDGVDKLIERGDKRPNDVEACSRVPGLQVPRKRDQDEQRRGQRKDREKRIGGVS